jgi:two-component system chemotaxis response regulator CheB
MPSADVLMKSVAETFGPNCLGVIMTGMGRDGADGCRVIRAAGGYVLGQDEATSDVYGMNKVAYVEGNVDRQFALEEAATVIAHQVRRLRAAIAVV